MLIQIQKNKVSLQPNRKRSWTTCLRRLVIAINLSVLVVSVTAFAAESADLRGKESTAVVATVLPKDSVFQIKNLWSNQDGKRVSLDTFRGKKTILAMVYTSCAHTCPMTISKIEELQRQLGDSTTDYQIVLASFDPQKDTPAHLKKYMTKRHLDFARWTFLTAKKDSEVRELAVVLGVSYKKIADGDFSHSNIVSLLDQNGVVKSKLEGFEGDTAEFLKALKEN